jgi:ribosomal protein L7/L12
MSTLINDDYSHIYLFGVTSNKEIYEVSHKIKIIKAIREFSGCGIQEARNYCEACIEGKKIKIKGNISERKNTVMKLRLLGVEAY